VSANVIQPCPATRSFNKLIHIVTFQQISACMWNCVGHWSFLRPIYDLLSTPLLVLSLRYNWPTVKRTVALSEEISIIITNNSQNSIKAFIANPPQFLPRDMSFIPFHRTMNTPCVPADSLLRNRLETRRRGSSAAQPVQKTVDCGSMKSQSTVSQSASPQTRLTSLGTSTYRLNWFNWFTCFNWLQFYYTNAFRWYLLFCFLQSVLTINTIFLHFSSLSLSVYLQLRFVNSSMNEWMNEWVSEWVNRLTAGLIDNYS